MIKQLDVKLLDFKKMYKDMDDLATNPDYRFIKDVKDLPNGNKKVLFMYGIIKSSLWKLKASKDMRGIVYETDKDFNPLRILCFPFSKFFSWGENEDSTFLFKEEDIISITDKLDGSLIATYIEDNTLSFKTGLRYDNKMCLVSREVVDKDPQLKQLLTDFTFNNYTVIMELTSNVTDYVIKHEGEPKLNILAVRNNLTGKYLDIHFDEQYNQVFKDYLVPTRDKSLLEPLFNLTSIDETSKELQSILDGLGEVEGLVVHSRKHGLVKCKTNWYVNGHDLLNHIYHDKTLISAVVEGKSDDLKAMLVSKSDIRTKIELIENIFTNYINAKMKIFMEISEPVEGRSIDDISDYLLNAKIDKKSFKFAFRRALGREIKTDMLSKIWGELFVKNWKNLFKGVDLETLSEITDSSIVAIVEQ